MNTMKTLTAITLSAALVPALAFSTAAFAQEQGGMQSETADQQSGARAGEQYLSSKPAGALSADDVIGKTVTHRGTDQSIGEIQDLVIGQDGRIAGVVIKTGGFMGLGGQDVGLAWDQLQHTMEEDESAFFVDMDEEKLREAPEYQNE